MSKQIDETIRKCLEDIKDICLVLTEPKKWQAIHKNNHLIDKRQK